MLFDRICLLGENVLGKNTQRDRMWVSKSFILLGSSSNIFWQFLFLFFYLLYQSTPKHSLLSIFFFLRVSLVENSASYVVNRPPASLNMHSKTRPPRNNMAAALKHKIQQRGNGANKMQSGYNRKYVLFFCVVEVKNNVSHIICFKFAK